MLRSRRLPCRALLLLAAALLLFPAAALAQISLSVDGPVGPGQPVTVYWSGMPGNAQDWLTLVPAGSSNEEWGDWTYTNGQMSGSYTFSGVDAGQYEVRVYLDWPNGGYNVAYTLPVTVGGGNAGPGPGPGPGPDMGTGPGPMVTVGPGPIGSRIITTTKDTSGVIEGGPGPEAAPSPVVSVSPDPIGMRVITTLKDTSGMGPGMGPGGGMGPGNGPGMGPGGGQGMGPGGGNNMVPGGGGPGVVGSGPGK